VVAILVINTLNCYTRRKHANVNTMADDKEKFWENLTKEYLTIDQKLNIIREHNQHLNQIKWDKTIASLKDYIENKKNE